MPICPRGHDSAASDYCDECGRPIERSGAPGAGPFPPVGGGYAVPEQRCLACDTPRTGDWRYCEACGHEFPGPGHVVQPPGYGGHAPIPPQTPPPPPPPMPPGYGQPPGPRPGGDPGEHAGYRPMAPQTPPPPGEPFDPWARPRAGTRTPPPPAQPMPGYPDPALRDPGYTEPPPAQRYGGSVFTEEPPPRTREVWTVVVTADQEYFQRVVAQGGPDAHSMRFPPYYEPWTVELRGERMRVGRRRNNDSSTAPEIDLTGPPGDPGISHLHCVLIERPDGSWALVDPGSRNGTTFNGGGDAVEVNVPLELRDGDCVHVGAWTTLQIRVTRR